MASQPSPDIPTPVDSPVPTPTDPMPVQPSDPVVGNGAPEPGSASLFEGP